MKERIWEIDFLRGIAIVLMVIFHVIVILADYYSYKVEYLSGFWYYEGKVSAITFMLVSGISSTFSKSNLKRGAIIFFYGMILTAVTYIYNPDLYIKFGILHFLGISAIIYHFISRLDWRYLLAISILLIFIGNAVTTTIDNAYLFPIGFYRPDFTSLDYYPIIPWFGVFLIGVMLGKTIYKERKSLIANPPKFEVINYIGGHSLLVYIVHVPVIFGVLYILLR